MTRQIKIFDTTLRDGEQCPGASLNPEEKLDIARQLAKLGVDAIEAGFAIASPGDFDSIKQIAQQIKGPIICSLARAKKEDIKSAWEAIKYSDRPRIHVFLATSPIHMEKKLRMTPVQVLATTKEMVAYAKSLCNDIEFSAEDAGRSEPAFLYKVVAAAIEAGASTINIPDTVGYNTPWEFGKLIENVIANVPQIKTNNVTISVHCHNDLGMAAVNSLAAIKAGANQVECTINGIGERAGNASLEEVVMTLKTRRDYFDCSTGINTKEIYRTSRMVSNLTGLLVQPNKAIVGANAFAHESGIHQAGMLRDKLTYEIMLPEDIGLTESRLVLGKHSGRNAFADKLKEMGYNLTEDNLEKAFTSFKQLADMKKEVGEADLAAIVSEEINIVPETFKIELIEVCSGTERKPSAKVKLQYKNSTTVETAEGAGPVDAVYRAIDKITRLKPNLVDYIIQAITGGTDAQGEVTVRLKEGEQVYVGHGASTDIILASAKAYVAAINRMIFLQAQNQAKGLD
ncbi:2-isopropylmalate synthase [candidate division WOR-1 bacterium RIFOXYA12_FULL_52_29]|uniref:2-isopropylmalate synthase n=1 Tax=candidate division WOR-1 bacterium RIFOXYC12_FULL_54_18 TaxID=1802584 RepID=A0A1F4T645_UNCSA|nr:MAG: 2-isopropylmalate synthase [candidate division WOR-1 bacterium RIFOXYA2_FULL_51_19]OGC17126.1 MAG: 2-isopropylmalate synthase [candidate division WOR-1 bacterium RIFOXYA12_FULL_52_29]OGC25986.1 MAG: 2-isopropylmalate synthase [candidate division WOR-1 bacterium RIFOXYB2_FULL_45_9]OGC27543.1 MAG: 2-isopropylmalate synthase [candidate division WOR-1 bacterium RIFOXYC12_FULL_54_18]OGC29244.1 MAG: 2-isopropylmalate synthase [candidate division WOR-1 bacterium RIFOXYB12_FULL_52_16]